MHSLMFENITGLHLGTLINRTQTKEAPSHEQLRDAVRAWAADSGQDVVSAHIVDQWRKQCGKGIQFPSDYSRARQKLFRYLDNRFDSEQYRQNISKLTPAIIAVLPMEYRARLVGANCMMSRLAEAEKEVAEAKQAIILDAPEHQKLKELSEGIASLFRLMPEQVGPLMTMVTTMLGAM